MGQRKRGGLHNAIQRRQETKTDKETYGERVERKMEYKQAENDEKEINNPQQTDQEYQGSLCVKKER